MKNNLKVLRKNRGLSQLKVAMDLNITQETISAYETEKAFPSPEMLIKIADYYKTSIDYILCRTKYDFPIDKLNTKSITNDEYKIIEEIRKMQNTK